MQLSRMLGAVALAWSLVFAPAQAASVTVFAAASLKNALDEVGREYARTGGEARFSYAASSAMARQIEQGAPADIYVSADADWMTYLAERRLVVAATRRDLLTNRLALIAPADSKAALKVAKGMPLARALGGGRLAVAGPDVPAGKYARAALISLGAWDGVSGKLAQAENVRTALQYVARGESPFGVVYDTDARLEPKVRIVGLFPAGSHPAIVYPAALVTGSKNPDAARFLSFMSGPQAAVVFRRHGFRVLPRR
ncbi:molybdate ABC transporter substrate-binding protein [Phenylobacterium sp. LH3H17]|uniref:molybdate ABC transporter substrate-binding protein n=1 Tax=Phenylobacterium sp. LH3H17 TaxID=2903901 RepID=UPI0020C9438C|nr:molybdate ABC transporter substrate-binding protein [Phenylobacterium sp. LH3H17]UTP38371.1 molybdate ABC transporter substrate-binding protein [Phenylobacterium sp. LH3H17]